MKTVVYKAADGLEETIKGASRILLSGGLVAIPTETVYGLAANALDTKAVAHIFEIKGRPQDNPLILHLSSAAEIERYCENVPEKAYELAARFWPGPLTMVLKRRNTVPDSVAAGLRTVAVRCPENEVTRKIIAEAGVPLAAPSANISGRPSTTTAQHVLDDLDGRIEAVVDDGACRVGIESTIIDLTSDPPQLLRPGGITPEQLESVLGIVALDKAVYAPLDAGEKPRAPGMKYRHYAPTAPVTIVYGEAEKAAAYINEHSDEKTAVLCFHCEMGLFSAPIVVDYGGEDDGLSLASGLFDALRRLDTPEISKIYARCPEGDGVAMAVRNRLQKAAAYNIVRV